MRYHIGMIPSISTEHDVAQNHFTFNFSVLNVTQYLVREVFVCMLRSIVKSILAVTLRELLTRQTTLSPGPMICKYTADYGITDLF